jgi:hypothetical protein
VVFGIRTGGYNIFLRYILALSEQKISKGAIKG